MKITADQVIKSQRGIFNKGHQVEGFVITGDRWNFYVYKINQIQENPFGKVKNKGMYSLVEETFHPDLRSAVDRILRDIEAERIGDLERVLEIHESILRSLEDLVSKFKSKK